MLDLSIVVFLRCAFIWRFLHFHFNEWQVGPMHWIPVLRHLNGSQHIQRVGVSRPNCIGLA